MKSAIRSSSPSPCQRSMDGAGSRRGDSPCPKGAVVVSLASSLWIWAWCLLSQADKVFFHVHVPSEKQNPTHWWNDSTIVTGRPCTVSKDIACLGIKEWQRRQQRVMDHALGAESLVCPFAAEHHVNTNVFEI